MTTENELIKKSYYQTIIDTNKNEHPIKMLGEMYTEEMKTEQPDLSSIRFAQGEVYFLNHDYEAAIYKWQHPLDKQFIPWAQKNIADAHMEMGLLEFAENFYKEVETASISLKSEVLLQLFSLYIQQDNPEKSVVTIKNAIKLNPDYIDVTEIAKRYFEDIHDWDSAIELAVNEAIRTESLSWIEILEGYARLGYTSNCRPNYFNEVLIVLFYMDKYRFERLTAALWASYQQSTFYFHWLEEINQILLNHPAEQSYIWKKLPNLFKEGYFYLISGEFLINDIQNLIQDHLANWIEVTSVSESHNSSAAILAWNEHFPSELAATLINEAEQQFKDSNFNQNGRQEGIELLDSIKIWAEKEGLLEGLTEFMKPKLDEGNIEEATPSSIRNLIKATLTYILEQRVELENMILEGINWNEKIQTELHNFHQEISDMKEEKSKIMTNSFRDLKNKLIESVQIKLPKVLQDCSSLVKEDSDFSKIHIEINEEMNKRISQYMETTLSLEFKKAFQKWIDTSEKELQESERLCVELSETINQQFKEEKVILSGDFKVLDDWRRDIERTSRILLRFEKVNILLRNSPSQLLLKSAGKVFGSFTKNNDLLLNRYRDYIKNVDYSEVVEETTKSFIQQLELFEESIEWDVGRFFLNPQDKISSLLEEVQTDIEKHNNSLTKLREKPETYRDPLTLFELKLRHYELVNTIS